MNLIKTRGKKYQFRVYRQKMLYINILHIDCRVADLYAPPSEERPEGSASILDLRESKSHPSSVPVPPRWVLPLASGPLRRRGGTPGLVHRHSCRPYGAANRAVLASSSLGSRIAFLEQPAEAWLLGR